MQIYKIFVLEGILLNLRGFSLFSVKRRREGCDLIQTFKVNEDLAMIRATAGPCSR